MVQHRAILTMADKVEKVVYDLSNIAIFNNLEQPTLPRVQGHDIL